MAKKSKKHASPTQEEEHAAQTTEEQQTAADQGVPEEANPEALEDAPPAEQDSEAQKDSPAEEPPVDHNPEALEDAAPTTTTRSSPSPSPAKPAAALPPTPVAAHREEEFANVDLEAGVAGTVVSDLDTSKASEHPHLSRKSSFTELAKRTEWSTVSFFLAFCSLIVMIQSAKICGDLNVCSRKLGYQVAVGTVSAFIGLVFGALNKARIITSPLVLEIVSVFQFLWWVAGVIVLTFFGSYQTTEYANGYFGSWGAFAFATLLFASASDRFTSIIDNASRTQRNPLFILVIASAVVMGASISPCSPQSECERYNAFAVSLGSISLIIGLILVFAAPLASPKVLKALGAFFVLWWVIGYMVVTFGDPFKTTGNGYFGSLIAVLASISFLQSTLRE